MRYEKKSNLTGVMGPGISENLIRWRDKDFFVGHLNWTNARRGWTYPNVCVCEWLICKWNGILANKYSEHLIENGAWSDLLCFFCGNSSLRPYHPLYLFNTMPFCYSWGFTLVFGGNKNMVLDSYETDGFSPWKHCKISISDTSFPMKRFCVCACVIPWKSIRIQMKHNIKLVLLQTQPA